MRKSLLVAVIGLGLVAPAFAHSPLKKTVPADGAELAEAPETITFRFGKDARLTKVIVERADAGEQIRLELPTKSFAQTFEMQGVPQDAGVYQVRWRALGEDGHMLTGSFGYTVAPR
ncbi:MAG: copper resistance protein CopC [Pseudomonadota bacterium]